MFRRASTIQTNDYQSVTGFMVFGNVPTIKIYDSYHLMK